MKSIEYRPLLGDELRAAHQALAAGNLEVRRLAALPGMAADRHLEYRRAVLGLRNGCTAKELSAIRRGSRGDTRELVQAVEALKPRLVEGYVAMVVREAHRVLPRVMWNCRNAADRRQCRLDLEQEASVYFLQAVYGYANPNIYLSTYATGVIRNNLNRYALSAPSRSIPEEVAQLVRDYNEAAGRLVGRGLPTGFRQVLVEVIRKYSPGISDRGAAAVIGSMGDLVERLGQALAADELIDTAFGVRVSEDERALWDAAEDMAVGAGMSTADAAAFARAVCGEGEVSPAKLKLMAEHARTDRETESVLA